MSKDVSDLPKIIAMHGAQGAGKDSVATYLVEEYGYIRLAFADRLKEMCLALNPIVSLDLPETLIEQIKQTNTTSIREVKGGRLADIVDKYGWDEAKFRFLEVRRTMQRLATEVIRDFVDYDYWVNVVREQAFDIIANQGGRVVVTDMRFENEAAMVERLKGQIWWITRLGNPNEQARNHRSEEWHPDRFYPVINETEGDMTAVYQQVDDILFGRITELYQPPVDEVVEIHS